MPDQPERLAWAFDKTIPNTDHKSARALEYIAYYLDRIEGHLAKIAGTLTEDPAGDAVTVMRALQDLAEALKTRD